MTPKQLLKYLKDWFRLRGKIQVFRKCKLAERDHAEDPRVFAHVFCRRAGTICLCKDFDLLPLGHQIGIIIHEIGHLMSKGGEAEADLWVQDNLDVDIEFKNLIQWVDPRAIGL